MMADSVLPFTPAEIGEIVRVCSHFTVERAHGAVTIQINYNDGDVPVVVVNGRRFDRKREHDAKQGKPLVRRS